MRSIQLGRVFDCVLVHDAVSYMASRADLVGAIATAFEHSSFSNTGHELFLGLRPTRGKEA